MVLGERVGERMDEGELTMTSGSLRGVDGPLPSSLVSIFKEMVSGIGAAGLVCRKLHESPKTHRPWG